MTAYPLACTAGQRSTFRAPAERLSGSARLPNRRGGPGGSSSLPEAAYRFARHEPGCHVVLTGTGSVEHLTANVASIGGPPLPADHLAQLQALFGHVDSVTGD